MKALMKCERFERDGEEFLNVTRFIIKMEPKNATIYLGNLFGGDEALGLLSKLVNETKIKNVLLYRECYESAYKSKLSGHHQGT